MLAWNILNLKRNQHMTTLLLRRSVKMKKLSKKGRKSLSHMNWVAIKPISILALKEAGMYDDDDIIEADFMYLASEAIISGFTNMDILDTDFVIKHLGSSGIQWFINNGFIKEDKTKFCKEVIDLLQKKYNKDSADRSTVECLVDLLIELRIITPDDIEQLNEVKDVSNNNIQQG